MRRSHEPQQGMPSAQQQMQQRSSAPSNPYSQPYTNQHTVGFPPPTRRKQPLHIFPSFYREGREGRGGAKIWQGQSC